MAFGPAEWEKYFGKVDPASPLPADIEEILNSPCHYWPEKKVRETHLLFYVPSQVNGQPLTLDRLGDLIQNPKGGGKRTKYGFYKDEIKKSYGSKVIEAHWVLMTRDVVPGSRNKSYKDQCALAKGGNEPPHLLEAAVGILMHHARSGERLLIDDPLTHTRCQEEVEGYQTTVGAQSLAELDLCLSVDDEDFFGLAFARNL